jgi:hypothetical protein
VPGVGEQVQGNRPFVSAERVGEYQGLLVRQMSGSSPIDWTDLRAEFGFTPEEASMAADRAQLLAEFGTASVVIVSGEPNRMTVPASNR